MKRNEIIAKAGSIFTHPISLVFLLAYSLFGNAYTTLLPGVSGTALDTLIPMALRFLVGPIALAAVYGSVHEQQEQQDPFDRVGFLGFEKKHLPRFIAVTLLSFIFYFPAMLIVMLLIGPDNLTSSIGNAVVAALAALFSVFNLFWLAGATVEQAIFRGLARSVKLFLVNPPALAIAVVWGATCFADDFFFASSGDVALPVNLARSAAFAVLRLLAIMYLLAFYKSLWGAPSDQKAPAVAARTSAPGEKMARAGIWFGLFSFIPFAHLAALGLGALALKRGRRFILKAAAACVLGGFFTLLYAMLVIGLLAGQPDRRSLPGYDFLADGQDGSGAAAYLALLEQGEIAEAQASSGGSTADAVRQDWTLDCALALSKYEGGDLEGALSDFYAAEQKNPDRGEFYVYYGAALLDNGTGEMAMEKFRMALERDPTLEIAERYISLIQNQYKPNAVSTALGYLIILLILFTLHEYGHAYAAWKLGDDTAKNQGRLTLNPIAHLSLFGSILLPAILLFQQSEAVFGWAKPVPVDRRNFRNPDKDDMVVSFAGPAVNLIIAMVCLVLLAALIVTMRVVWPETISFNLADPYSVISLAGLPAPRAFLVVIEFLKQFFYSSLLLGIFNLLPIPPLDGSWILAAILPQGARAVYERARQFGFLILILLSMTPVLDIFLAIPIGFAWVGFKTAISAMGFA